MSEFGEKLGECAQGVIAYSNGRADFVGSDLHFVDGHAMGIPWQCVEYARRWIWITKGFLLPEVQIAADFWAWAGRSNSSAERHTRGSTQSKIETGDLLIWGKGFRRTGHIAVVLQVDQEEGVVKIGEQNFNQEVWRQDHSRALPLENNNLINEPEWLGWIHLEL